MENLAILVSVAVIIFIAGKYNRKILQPIQNQTITEDDFCIIDIRDYIEANRSPYPGAENIPLSYLPRELKKRFDCPKNILLVTDDIRGAKLAARMIRKTRQQPIYYVQSR